MSSGSPFLHLNMLLRDQKFVEVNKYYENTLDFVIDYILSSFFYEGVLFSVAWNYHLKKSTEYEIIDFPPWINSSNRRNTYTTEWFRIISPYLKKMDKFEIAQKDAEKSDLVFTAEDNWIKVPKDIAQCVEVFTDYSYWELTKNKRNIDMSFIRKKSGQWIDEIQKFTYYDNYLFDLQEKISLFSNRFQNSSDAINMSYYIANPSIQSSLIYFFLVYRRDKKINLATLQSKEKKIKVHKELWDEILAFYDIGIVSEKIIKKIKCMSSYTFYELINVMQYFLTYCIMNSPHVKINIEECDSQMEKIGKLYCYCFDADNFCEFIGKKNPGNDNSKVNVLYSKVKPKKIKKNYDMY